MKLTFFNSIIYLKRLIKNVANYLIESNIITFFYYNFTIHFFSREKLENKSNFYKNKRFFNEINNYIFEFDRKYQNTIINIKNILIIFN